MTETYSKSRTNSNMGAKISRVIYDDGKGNGHEAPIILVPFSRSSLTLRVDDKQYFDAPMGGFRSSFVFKYEYFDR